MTSKPFKPTLPEAALIEWLLADPARRFAVCYGNSGVVHLCERTVEVEEGRWDYRRISSADPSPEDQPTVARFGGKLKFDPHNLKFAGLVTTFAAATQWPEGRKAFEAFDAGIFRRTRWSYDSTIVVLTDAAEEWWKSKGQAAHEKMLAKLLAKKAAAAALERVGVFGSRWSYDAGPYRGKHSDDVGRVAEVVSKAESVMPKWSGMRPAFSAVIVRETDTRYYLRDTVSLTNSWLRPDGGAGRNVEKYIEKKYLILDNATAADIERLKDFDAEIISDYAAMRDKLVDEMIPMLIASLDRRDQKSAEIDGTFDELMESIRARKP
ncbi:hypothetical protein G6L37_06515 [Agrobacterium rubi]|nr:hypothetical protein [Agrobacterium rubi]NTF25016.1 hypothetical protein [Agrobacterium rubi]